ncbi:DUF2304 domain-containing protein [Ectobacillus ponti]|uniref:DUF2304 domain-containing protein n=1 Tax=Ectobacillus ponti TaxID=2961894 RepID=A0AA42BS25_9BACI|nr:DUF2304 domain-containing protein [Ectobacillus ponti]MCP8967993.1 DUF2304 domain-containing protein [Ectobacillus ponti]
MTIYTFSFLISLLALIVVVMSVHKKQLDMRFSLFWIFACVAMMLLSINESVVNNAAKWLNVYYAPSLLFLVGFIFVLLLIFHLTRIITKLDHRLTRLTQRYALLEAQQKEEDEE